MKTIFLLVLVLLIIFVSAQDPDPGEQDHMSRVPGYPDGQGPRVFAGFLQSKSSGHKMHYILVEGSDGQKNNLALTVWFNGGPGCSSKIGFLQQIGPYLLPEGASYVDGTQLTQNKYSWHKISNLLFIDTPAGTGYNEGPADSYIYNDQNTADDNLNALIYFFNEKFPSYKDKKVFLAGQSYAGKYIPDLVLRINAYNSHGDFKINLNGIMVGNGIMDFVDGSLEKNQIQYMFSRNLIDPTLTPYWATSCENDPASAGCAFFFNRYDNLLNLTNMQNLYGSCPKQEAKTLTLSNKRNMKAEFQHLFKKCQFYSGIDSYFKISRKEYSAEKSDFEACNQTVFKNYERNDAGSMNQYGRIIAQMPGIGIYFYNGDWDDTVPFTDTLKNLQRLGMRPSGSMTPLLDQKNQQHVGFSRTFTQGSRKLTFWTIKGAGLKASQSKGEIVYRLYKTMLGK